MKRSATGRPKSNPTWNCFELDKENQERLKCMIGQCTYSPATPKNGASNLERHLKRVHPKEYEAIEKEKERMNDLENQPKNKQKQTTVLNNVQMSVDDIMDAMVCCVTISGRPFASMDDPGMQWIISRLLAAAPSNERKAINSESVRRQVERMARSTRSDLREEFKSKLISIKVDGVSRLGRSFLGVNAQFIKNGKLELRTLGVVEILLSHTGFNISNLILDVLSPYGIVIDNVYSITIDNGSNMVKAAELLLQEQMKSTTTSGIVPGSDEDSSDISESSFTSGELFEQPDDLLEEGDVVEVFEDCESTASIDTALECTVFATDEGLLSCVRCAAHTLHLAIGDTLKSSEETKELLKNMRKLAKRLRTPRARRYLSIKELSVPSLDCETRWCSCVDMLSSLMPLKEFCSRYLELLNKGAKKKVKITNEDFDAAVALIELLIPTKEAMKKLQSEQLIMGDFFKIWHVCKIKVKKLTSKLAQEMLYQLNRREGQLYSNYAFLAAIYMDPRYFKLLNNDALEAAEKKIVSVWHHLEKIRVDGSSHEEQFESEAAPEANKEVDQDDEFEMMLQVADGQQQHHERRHSRRNILPLLKEYRRMTRLGSDVDLLKYWESQKFLMPELYSISQVVLAAPATQVSVERLFSGVKFVLSDLRHNLKSDIFNDIMVIRTNHIFKKASLEFNVTVPESPANIAVQTPAETPRRGKLTPSSSGSISLAHREEDEYDFPDVDMYATPRRPSKP